MASFNLFNTLKNDLQIDSVGRTVSVIPQLKPRDYAQVKNILNRLGGEWVTQRQQFQFSKCPQSQILRVLSLGSRRLNKFHFYPTPEEIFSYITKFTPLSFFGASERKIRVLEPSCGEGSLIRQLQAFGEIEGRQFDIDGYDIDPLNVIFCQEAGMNVQQMDFLNIEAAAEYDLVIMNPPFNGDEFIKHIEHAQKFLKTNGLLISIVPTQWIKTFEGKANRLWLLEQAQIDSTSDLAENNFFEPGTFKGVSIPTTVICLGSCQAAEGVLHSEKYRKSSIEAFGFYIDNNEKNWDKLHRIKMEERSADGIVNAVKKLISSIMQDATSDTTHLVRRYEEDYALFLVEEWFPEYAYMLRKSPIEPRQLAFEIFNDERQAA
jgi:2-polyprenyl-3-methyl-5-hydroxy-6-metoxy-1,4-benzoquinol methylase